MKEQINNELSEYLKLLRFKKKISQEEIADRLKVTRQCYTNWENNPIKLNLGQLIEIGIVLNEDVLIFFNNYIAKRNNNKTQIQELNQKESG